MRERGATDRGAPRGDERDAYDIPQDWERNRERREERRAAYPPSGGASAGGGKGGGGGGADRSPLAGGGGSLKGTGASSSSSQHAVPPPAGAAAGASARAECPARTPSEPQPPLTVGLDLQGPPGVADVDVNPVSPLARSTSGAAADDAGKSSTGRRRMAWGRGLAARGLTTSNKGGAPATPVAGEEGAGGGGGGLDDGATEAAAVVGIASEAVSGDVGSEDGMAVGAKVRETGGALTLSYLLTEESVE